MTSAERVAHRTLSSRQARHLKPGVLLLGKRVVTTVAEERPGWVRIAWARTDDPDRTGTLVVEETCDIAVWELT